MRYARGGAGQDPGDLGPGEREVYTGRNVAVPGGELSWSETLPPEEAEKLKERWLAAWRENPRPVVMPAAPVTLTGIPRAICPDLLRLQDLGEADNWRGRVVRGFFRVLGWTTGV